MFPTAQGIPINKRLGNNTAGVTAVLTGASSLVSFLPKFKTSPTLRNLFADCPWADPFSFNDIVQADDFFLDGDAIEIVTPFHTGTLLCLVLDNSIGPFTDAMTGNTSTETICFVAISDFTHDLGNVPLPSCLIRAIPTAGASTSVGLANGNRACLETSL